METEQELSYKKQCERKVLFKSFGYDFDQEAAHIIENAHPIKSPILEIGTGKGYFAGALAQQGYSFVTIDAALEEQEYARKSIECMGLSKQVTFHIGNAESMTYRSKAFKTIFAVNVFHHIKKPFVVLDEMMRILDNDGKFIISDFNERGREIIEKMHCAEGRTHKAEGHCVPDLTEYVRGQNRVFERLETECQHALIVYGRG